MSELVLSTTEEIMKELESRFESIVMAGAMLPIHAHDESPEEEKESTQYKMIKGDAAEMNLMLDVMKLEVLGQFMGSARDPEAWER